MAIIDVFAWELQADTKKLSAGIDKAKTSVESLDKNFAKLDKTGSAAATNLTAIFSRLAVVAAGIFSVGSIVGKTREYAAHAEALNDLSQSTGVAVEKLDAFEKAAESSGSSASTATDLIQATARAMGNEAEVLEKQGIAVRDAAGNMRPTLDVMLDMSEKMKDMDPQAASAFMRNFRIIDPAMINMMRKGREGLDALIRSKEREGVMTKESTESALAYNDAQRALSETIQSAWDDIGAMIIPILTKITKAFDDAIKFGKNHIDFFKVLAGVVGVVLIPTIYRMTTAWGAAAIAQTAALAPFLLLAAAVAGIALVIDDVNNYLDGNQSIIGDLAKEYPELGAAVKSFVKWVQESWDAFIVFIDTMPGRFNKSLSEIADFFSVWRDNVVGVVKALANDISVPINWVIGKLKGLWDLIANFGNWAGSGIVGLLDKVTGKSDMQLSVAKSNLAEAGSAPTNSMTSNSITNSPRTSTVNMTNNTTINAQGGDARKIGEAVSDSNESTLRELRDQSRGGAAR